MVEARKDDQRAYVGLNGCSDAISEVNRLAGLNITLENVVDYVSFFCGFILSESRESFILVSELPSYTVDGVMPDNLSPMVAAPDDMPGHFYVKGYTVYEGQLFLTLYLVHPTGEVGMVDEDPIEPLMRLQ